MQSRPAPLLIGALAFAAGLLGEIVSSLAAPLKRALLFHPRPEPFGRAIVGHSKRHVVSLLGPPPAAALAGQGSPPPTYWRADTWYYPYDPDLRTAVAVQFSDDRVIGIEFIPAL